MYIDYYCIINLSKSNTLFIISWKEIILLMNCSMKLIMLDLTLNAKKLRMCAQSFDGDVLRLPELKNGLITNEGAIAYEEAAAYVENLPKLPMIHLDPNLSFAAKAIANEMTYYNDVSEMNSINREEIMEQYGKYEGALAMSSDFGSLTPEFVVMNLIVDDGNK